MPDPVTAVTGALSIGSTLLKDDAAESSANTQSDAAARAMAENNRRYKEIVELFKPYTSTGQQANNQLGNVFGLNGNKAQQDVIANLQKSPIFQGLMKQGETSILQNASATGGLRGGNVQQALSQFSPNLLNTLLKEQISGLQGLNNGGINSVGALATANQNLANNNSQLIQDQGAYQAGATQAQGQNRANLLGGFGQVFGGLGGGSSPFGGSAGNSGALFGAGIGSSPLGTFGADLALGLF